MCVHRSLGIGATKNTEGSSLPRDSGEKAHRSLKLDLQAVEYSVYIPPMVLNVFIHLKR